MALNRKVIFGVFDTGRTLLFWGRMDRVPRVKSGEVVFVPR
jgi:hypothetical protein